MTFKEIAAKKVAGIPVLYLAAAAVIVLAIVAWRMKSSPDSSVADALTGEQSDAELDDNGLAVPGSDPYAGLSSNGTVTVVQQPTQTQPEVEEIVSNDEWVRQAAEWLTAKHNVAGSDAASALNKYVEGQDRTFQEQEWVNLAIAEKGQPPNTVTSGGSVSTKPAQKQITPPGYHTVTGSSDNDYPKLASLYYNSSAGDRVDLLQAANTSLGRRGPFPTGSRVMIPAYHAPVYFLTSSAYNTAAKVAARNGLTLTQLAYLNNPKNEAYAPTYPFKNGTRIRVK